MKTFRFALIMLACTISVAASAASSEEDWNFTDGSITVTVVDEHGHPVPNLDVLCSMDCYSVSGSRIPDPTVHSMQTGSDGKTTFSGLVAASYMLHTKADKLGAWARTELLRPEHKHLDIPLQLDVYTTYQGIVRDSLGVPLPDVRVLARRSMPAAVTDEAGRFVVENVPQDIGSLPLLLSKDGYGTLETGARNMDVTMRPGEQVYAVLVDTEGNPMSGMLAWYKAYKDEYHISRRIETDGIGGFKTMWLPVGYEVTLGAWHTSDGKKWKAEEVVLLAAGAENRVTLQLKPYSPPPATYISGRVVMAGTGEAVPAHIMHSEHSEGVRETDIHTDAEGRFVLEDLGFQKQYVTVFPDDHTLYPTDGVLAIDLSDGQPFEDVTIEVAQGCAIRGRVISADGLPVPEEQVTYVLQSSSGTRFVPGFTHRVFTEDDGRFEIPCLPCTGEPFRLQTERGQSEISTLVGPLQKGQVADEVLLQFRDVYLQPTVETAVRGIIVDTAGNPLDGARVRLRSLVQTVTDEQGQFEVPYTGRKESRLQIAIEGNIDIDMRHLMQEPRRNVRYGGRELYAELDTSEMGTLKGVVREIPERGAFLSSGSGNDIIELPPAVAGATVTLTAPHGDETVITKSDGSFEFPFRQGGTVQFDISVSTRLSMGEMTRSLTQKAILIEGGTLTLEAGTPVKDARVVVELEPARFVAGTVTDEDGNPLDADTSFWQKDLMGDVSVQNGRFIRTDLLDGPVLLEFRQEGYQAALLENGRDFKVGDRNISVVMKKGPFPEGTNVFTAVTGYEDSEEGISQLLRGENLRSRVGRWERLAKKGEEERQQQYEIYVTDAEGNPLNRIWVEEATTYNQPAPTRETAVVDQRSEREILSSEDGRYTLREHPWRMPWKRSAWISAEGTARALFLASEYDPEQAPVHITLHPTSKITIRVVDFDGDPVSGLAVGAAARSWEHASSNFYYLPKIGMDGTVVFDKLSPGLYGYRIYYVGKTAATSRARAPMSPRFVTFRVESGESYERTVEFGKPRPGTAEAVLNAWEQEFKKREWRREKREEIGTAPRELRESVRRDLAGLITGRLDELVGRYHFERDEASMLAVAAERYGLKEAIPAIQSVLSRWYISPVQMIQADYRSQVTVLAIVKLAGDDTVDFFASTATDRVYPYWIRSLSLVALGQIGTEKSVDAFVQLRDAAYGTPGAPSRKQQYTHEEKIAETLEMVFNVIAWQPESEDDTPPMVTAPEKAVVSEDGTTGTIGCSFNRQGRTRIHMKRFGDEWLVVRIGSTIIS